MSKFRKRDIVTALKSYDNLEEGATYEVYQVFIVGQNYYDPLIKLRNVPGTYPSSFFGMGEAYDPNFSPGDNIFCIDDYGCSTIEKGLVYKVKDVQKHDSYCGRENRVQLEETGHTYMAARFEPSEPSEIESPHGSIVIEVRDNSLSNEDLEALIEKIGISNISRVIFTHWEE